MIQFTEQEVKSKNNCRPIKMAKSFIEKISRLRQIINENGGILSSVKQIYRTDELKTGKLIGEDEYGNKYYQNTMYFMGRSRWVEYSPSVGMDYDGSQIPAEWHPWLHYMTDVPPTVSRPVRRPWMQKHTENLSGTPGEYVPYSTTRPKVQSWQPPKRA